MWNLDNEFKKKVDHNFNVFEIEVRWSSWGVH